MLSVKSDEKYGYMGFMYWQAIDITTNKIQCGNNFQFVQTKRDCLWLLLQIRLKLDES